MDANALQNVKLKKTTVQERPKVAVDERTAQQYHTSIINTYVENWFDAIKDHTFDTVFLDLTAAQAKAINAKHEQWKKNKITLEQALHDLEIDEPSFITLREQCTNVIQSFPNKQAFVKLSSRSPKDVCDEQVFEKLYNFELETLTEEQRKDNHELVLAISRAATKMLRVESYDEVISLLVQSERVHEDFEEELYFRPEKFGVSLVLREWWAQIDIDLEFRAFVYDNQLNALSQYNYICYIDYIVKYHPQIVKRIKEFFEIARPKLTHVNSYIIDFTVDRHSLYNENIPAQDCIRIIELNPFEVGTGACLFDWKTDLELFKHGPFEFRFLENRDAVDPYKNINKDYRKYLV
jgi:hypothetical protein